MSDFEINIKNLSMIYESSGQKVEALKNVNLDIRRGEFISFLGPSGCGKTTLLRIIADLLQPTEGEVLIGGKTPEEIRKEKKYGIVFQNPVLYEWRKIKDNVALPLELMKISRKQREQRSIELLSLVGLEGFQNCYPRELSGGMQQRVSIARALAAEPEILLMDEPFSALDEFSREKMNEEILRIWAKTKKTVVFVTHSIAEAAFLSDRVCILSPHPGRLSTIIDVPFQRPRTSSFRQSSEFFGLVSQIRSSFEEVTL
ncbi:MAG: ABC transporter ATP-binding protein [Clostridia bacterium]|nr:ABC transporter ATP-binding protein [Clostridia bacterium]